MHFEVSSVVRAPRDKVYSTYTDFEAMPRWSRQTKGVTVSESGGNTVYVKVQPGSNRKAAMEMKLFPPERIETGRETRFTRTKRVVQFEEVQEGTKVTASLDVKFKGRWGWILKTQGRAEAESEAIDELASFARYVERLP